jgi:hypothetical protein
MAARKVEHVDVVADRGAVFGAVVVAEDEELLALANGDLRQQGKQVVRHTKRVLAHDTAGMRTSGVEVPQQCGVPFLCFFGLAGFFCLHALRGDGVFDDALDGGFCAAVDVGWADGAVLWDGDHVGDAGRVAVDGGGRGEDDVCDIVLGHGGEERDRATDVDFVVGEGDLGGLANGLCGLLKMALWDSCLRAHLESGKVDDIVNVGVLGEHFVEASFVCDVAVVEGGSLAADELDAVDDFLRRVVEVVNDDDLVVCLKKCESCKGANVARTTAMSQSLLCYTILSKFELELIVGVWRGSFTYPATNTDPTTILKSCA